MTVKLMLFIFRWKHDDVLRQSGDFVHLLFNGDAGMQVFELNGAANFRENRESVTDPIRPSCGPSEQFGLLVRASARAVRNFVAFFFAALFVNNETT